MCGTEKKNVATVGFVKRECGVTIIFYSEIQNVRFVVRHKPIFPTIVTFEKSCVEQRKKVANFVHVKSEYGGPNFFCPNFKNVWFVVRHKPTIALFEKSCVEQSK